MIDQSGPNLFRVIDDDDNAQLRERGEVRRGIWLLQLLSLLTLVTDVGLGIASGYLSLGLYLCWRGPPSVGDGPLVGLGRDILMGSLVTALILNRPAMETNQTAFNRKFVHTDLFWRGAAAISVLVAIGILTRTLNDLSRLWVMLWAGSFAIFLVLYRIVLFGYLRRLAGRGALRGAVAIIGRGGSADHLARRLAEQDDIVTVMELDADDEGVAETARELGRRGHVDIVVIALGQYTSNLDVGLLLNQLKEVPVQVVVCHNFLPLNLSATAVRLVGGIPMIVMADPPIRLLGQMLKAIFDRVIALTLLIILLPLLLAVSVIIVSESDGPILFRQRRSGWAGTNFTVLKFRTMRVGLVGHAVQTRRNDPRFTRVGKYLRQSSIDELPQLWNVLRGDMSLVGPRPHADALHERERVGQVIIADYAHRHRMKPGITGWAQVNGLRGPATTQANLRRRIEYDLHYIDNWSFTFDLKILLLTPLCVLRGENAL